MILGGYPGYIRLGLGELVDDKLLDNDVILGICMDGVVLYCEV